MASERAQVRKAKDLSPHFHQSSGAELAKKWAPRLAYGAAATWYVRTGGHGPQSSLGEKLVRRGAATALGIGIFKGKDIYKAIRGDNKNGVHKSNKDNAHRARRSSGTRRRTARK